jgi:predicted peroxiredoxin
MFLRGLTFVAIRPAALRAGLELATANAALGGRARVFCQGEAVTALARLHDPHDSGYATCGLPTLAEIFDESQSLGVEVIACQSGLLLTGLTADRLDPRIQFGGLVSLLQTLGEDRLVTG